MLSVRIPFIRKTIEEVSKDVEQRIEKLPVVGELIKDTSTKVSEIESCIRRRVYKVMKKVDKIIGKKEATFDYKEEDHTKERPRYLYLPVLPGEEHLANLYTGE